MGGSVSFFIFVMKIFAIKQKFYVEAVAKFTKNIATDRPYNGTPIVRC